MDGSMREYKRALERREREHAASEVLLAAGLALGDRVYVIGDESRSVGTVVGARRDGLVSVKHDRKLYTSALVDVFIGTYFPEDLGIAHQCPNCKGYSTREVYSECDACIVGAREGR